MRSRGVAWMTNDPPIPTMGGMFLYSIESAPGIGRVLADEGVYLNKVEADGYGGRPEGKAAAAEFERFLASYEIIHHYVETEEADTDGGIDRTFEREEPYPFSLGDAVFRDGKLVGLFLYFPYHWGRRENAHLFLLDDPSTGKYAIDRSRYYELRKK